MRQSLARMRFLKRYWIAIAITIGAYLVIRNALKLSPSYAKEDDSWPKLDLGIIPIPPPIPKEKQYDENWADGEPYGTWF